MPTALAQVDREKIYQWINELSSPETRENALLELSKKRESVPDLAPMLWHSFGTIAALLQVRQAAASAWCRACAHQVDLGRSWWDLLLPLLGSIIFVGSCGRGADEGLNALLWLHVRSPLTQLCPCLGSMVAAM